MTIDNHREYGIKRRELIERVIGLLPGLIALKWSCLDWTVIALLVLVI